MHNLKLWLKAIRIYSFPASLCPVVLGAVFTVGYTIPLNWTIFLCTAFCALLMQIAANLFNDYFDWKNLVDTDQRVGFTRACGSRILNPREVKIGAWLCLAVALLVGLYLIKLGGAVILIYGLLSLIFSYLYTGGPYPLAYHAMGELFVVIFFGIVAVSGTFYLQSTFFVPEVFVYALPPGLISAAIMAVNNYRDATTDQKAGKVTLAILFPRAARYFPVLFLLSSLLFTNSYWNLTLLPVAYAVHSLVSSNIPKLQNVALKLCGVFLMAYTLIQIALLNY